MTDGCIEGEGIKGSSEKIYPKVIWEPKQQDTKREEICFTELVKCVSDDARDAIIQYGGFKGNAKRYDKNEEGNYVSARFSWWSVYIPQDEIKRLKDNLSEGEELADIYEPSSRYGTNVFHLDLDQLLKAYAESCGCKPEIRVLGTYVYKRETMKTFVVSPSGHDIFKEHSLVDVAYFRKVKDSPVDDDYCGQAQNPHDDNDFEKVQHSPVVDAYFEKEKTYFWKPFSVIKWDNSASVPKERMWDHQAFAFFLDPLPNKIMLVPEVDDEKNWEICSQSEINLVTTLMI